VLIAADEVAEPAQHEVPVAVAAVGDPVDDHVVVGQVRRVREHRHVAVDPHRIPPAGHRRVEVRRTPPARSSLRSRTPRHAIIVPSSTCDTSP
jgi:hypothetical protein